MKSSTILFHCLRKSNGSRNMCCQKFENFSKMEDRVLRQIFPEFENFSQMENISKIWEFLSDGGYCPQTDDGGYLQKGNRGSTWSPLFQLLINNLLRKPKYRQSLKDIQNLKSISWVFLCKWSSTRISSKIHGWIWENGVRVHSWMRFISKICCSFKNEKSDEIE